MDLDRAALVVCITLAVVVFINIAIYLSVTRRRSIGEIGEIEMLRKAAQRARDPWGQEEQDLTELSKRVQELKQRRGRQEPDGG